MTQQSRRPPPRDPKVEALRVDGTLHRRAHQIRDPLFGTHDFFDARDVVQVRYEMIRRVEIDGQAVVSTAAAYHVSRPTFYAAHRAFQQRGLAGLVPKKRGPRGGHKLTSAVVAFLHQARAQEASVRPAALAQQVADRFGTTIHPPDDRTRAGAPGKKTAIDPAAASGAETATLPDSARTDYETLRRAVLGGGPRGRELGCALVLRQGLAAWIRAWSGCRVPARPAGGRAAGATIALPDGLRADVTRLLVSLAIGAHSKETHDDDNDCAQ